MPINEDISVPLLDNGNVRELLAILRENKIDTQDLRELLGHIGSMERQLDTAVGELLAMRHEMNELREAQDHRAARPLRNAANDMEAHIDAARERLESLKQSVINGCKQAIAAFKEKGISALNNIANFLGINRGLQTLRDSLTNGMEAAGKSIARVEAISQQYHEIGRAVKNMGRAIAEKEAEQEAKPVGKLAKAIEAPMKAQLSCLSAIRKSVYGAIAALTRLERAAERPSVMENIHSHRREQADRAKPNPPSADTRRKPEPSL